MVNRTETYRMFIFASIIERHGRKFTLPKEQRLSESNDLQKCIRNDASLSSDAKVFIHEIVNAHVGAKVIHVFGDHDDRLSSILLRHDTLRRYIVLFRSFGSEEGGKELKPFPESKDVNEAIRVEGSIRGELLRNDNLDTLVDILHEQINIGAPDNYGARYDIVLGGFGLGGGLATLCGLRLANEFFDHLVRVYSFGSPRVGNRDFKEACEMREKFRVIRVCNERDKVTASPWLGYSHVGDELWFFDDQWFVYEASKNRITLSLALSRSPLVRWRTSDHALSAYSKNVSTMYKRRSLEVKRTVHMENRDEYFPGRNDGEDEEKRVSGLPKVRFTY